MDTVAQTVGLTAEKELLTKQAMESPKSQLEVMRGSKKR